MKPAESFIGQSIRSLQTMLRVIAQDRSWAPDVVPDGIYGQDTLSAVSTFQRQFGLPVTGITDQETWEAIVGEYEEAIIRVGKAESIEILTNPGQVFRRGDRSPYLYLVQSILTVLSEEYINLDRPDHTGVLDEITAASIAAFQILAGLPSTGELDRKTWKHLVNHFTLSANRRARFL